MHEYTINPSLDWQQEYVYDRWGNRTIHQSNTWGPNIPKPNFGVNSLTNQLTAPSGSLSYDAAGNLTNDNYPYTAGQRTFDAENRMTQAWANNQWQIYTYNADGQRVRRKVDGFETWQVYGMEGELIAEYPANAAPTSPQKEYGYRNGQLLITASPGTSSVSTENVSWTDLVGVSASGNSLTKTAAAGWNAGAISTQAIASGDGYVEFTASADLTDRLCGLSVGNSGQGSGDIDFAINLSNGGFIYALEGGVLKASGGSYATGDQLRVAVVSGVVKYSKNGSVFYTSSATPSYPLLVDTALYENGAMVSNALLSGNLISTSTENVSWTDLVGVSASGNSLTKTAAAGWNAGAISTKAIASGDGYVEFTASADLTDRLCGLSVGNSGQGSGDVDFAIYLSNGGFIYAFEGGVEKANGGSYATGDHLRVTVASGVVKYSKNGSVFYTSSATPSYPLLVDTALYPTGSTISNVIISGNLDGGASGGDSIQWLVPDQLGTPRMIFDKTGSLANTKRHDYLPFGEELFTGTGSRTTVQGYTGDSVRQKFTQKERDNETGLDYFLARYYSSTQGRFSSPDEFKGGPRELFILGSVGSEKQALPYAEIAIPQSLNKYQYAYNNPLRFIDPDGHKVRFLNEPEADRRETKGRLLYNLKSSERQYFTVKYDSEKKAYFLALKGNVDKALSQAHTKAFEYMVQTVRNDKTVGVGIAEAFVTGGTSTSIPHDAGGGITVYEATSTADVQVVLARGGNPGVIYGLSGNPISDPKSVIAAHEVLGHARLFILGQPHGQPEAINVENEIRKGRGLEERAP